MSGAAVIARAAEPPTPPAPAPAVLPPPALPPDAPRAGFTIRVPQRGAHVMACSGCGRAVGLASLRWLPGRLQVGCVACANGEEVHAR